MKGFSPDIDWVKFAYENRVLEGAIPYKEVRDPWQADIDHALTTQSYVYQATGRGHSKTDTYIFWALVLMTMERNISAIAAGSKRDNANRYRESARRLVGLHPHLFGNIEVGRDGIKCPSTDSQLEIISSDERSSGYNFDLLLMGDLHEWEGESGQQLWSLLIGAMYKRPCRVWMESNALDLTTFNAKKWHKEARDKIEEWAKDPASGWYYFKPDGFVASWSRDRYLAMQGMIPSVEYQRQVLNHDVDGSESWLTREQIDAIENLSGPHPGFASKEERKGLVVVTADLGHVEDATAIAAVQALPVPRGAQPKLRLLRLDTLVPARGKEVQGTDIQDRIRLFETLYKPFRVILDVHQAKHLIQANYGWEGKAFSAGYNVAITEAMFASITHRFLELYPDAGHGVHMDGNKPDVWNLRRELLAAILKPTTQNRYRMDHQSDGYNDRMTAVAMGVHALLEEQHSPLLREEPKVEDYVRPIFSGKALLEKFSNPQMDLERFREG